MKRLETIRGSRRRALILLLPVLAAGCDPIIDVAGANFPAWLLCAICGGLGLAILRVIFLQLGLEAFLWWAPGVYTAAAIVIACTVWMVFFNRI